jgi:pimeloyl-ACP methyl ester carboxylesterase
MVAARDWLVRAPILVIQGRHDTRTPAHSATWRLASATRR